MAIEKKTNKVVIDINVQLIEINEVSYAAVWIEATSIKKINGNSRGIYKCGCRINQISMYRYGKNKRKAVVWRYKTVNSGKHLLNITTQK